MKNRGFFKKWLGISVLLFCVGMVTAQQIDVSGVVTDAISGEPIPGVSVVQKNTMIGTITDVDGVYRIEVERGSTIVFSSVGYLSKEVIVESAGTYNVVLESAMYDVDEVVVTALGISRQKKSLGYTVSEVESEEVSRVKETNVMNSLAGRVAGVTITQGAFGPGGGSRVIIRGNNSLSQDNQPLYVVDGVPIDNSGYGSANENDVGSYSKTDYGTGVSDINPDDIESISVLKGPNAAALYGSRAANGVILITTKRGGESDGLGVTVSSSLTFDRPMVLPSYQNQYGQGTQVYVPENIDDLKEAGGSWGAKLDGSDKLYWTGETRPYTAQPDNVKDFFETGQTLITNVAIDGGNKDQNVRFSYTNTHSGSILPNSSIDRHNFTLRGYTKLAGKLTLDAKATYFFQHGKNRPKLGTEGVMAYVYGIPRNADINDYKDYQNPETLEAVSHTSLGANPYWMMYNDRREDWRHRFQGFFKIEYQFNDWLSAHVRVGTDLIKQNIENVEAYGHWFFGTGRFSYNQYQDSETNADFLFLFNKDLSSSLNLSTTFGGNHMYSDGRSMRINGDSFRIPEGPPVSIASNVYYGYSPLSKKKINSLYGTASLGYNNWFYLDASLRNDWSSTLPKGNRSYSYPSLSGSVLLNEMLDLSGGIMSFSKIRMSWAQVGNDTSPYMLEDILMFVNCTDDFSDINQNPSAINAGDISARYFITKSQVKLMAPDRYPYWRAHLIHADRYAGHFCFGHSSSWWSDELGYSYNGGYTDAAWDWLEGYTGNIVTYLQLTGPGGDKENSLAYATALILKSIYYQYFTDVFGDVPYSEAGNLDVLLPKFDSQRDIYAGIIEDLDQAMELIGNAERTGDGEEDLGANDLFYGGDLQQWKKLANTLKLRAGLRALGAEDAQFAQTAVTAALSAPLLSSEEDNALLPKDNVISQWNSACYGDIWYNFIGGGNWTVSQPLINYLKDNGDPRLSKYAQPAVGGENIEIPWPESDDEAMYQKRKNFILDALDWAGAVYEEVVDENGVSFINMAENTYYVGQPVRLRSEMSNYARFSLFSTPAQYIIQAKGEDEPIAPEIVMTTAESYFLQAEAIVRGIGSGDANEIYRQGLRHAMLLWDVDPSEIDDFLANSPMANLDGSDDLEKIAIQRWLAYYTEGFQAWAVVRDLGFPSDLADGVDDPEIFGYGNIAGKYPERMRYGSNAYSRNNENLQEAIDRQGPDQQDTELWWAK